MTQEDGWTAESDVHPGIRAILTERQRAERLLYDVASELRFVPVDETTRGLHVRALEIKAALSRWLGEPPPAHDRRALFEDVVALRARVREVAAAR